MSSQVVQAATASPARHSTPTIVSPLALLLRADPPYRTDLVDGSAANQMRHHEKERPAVPAEINVLALVKGSERYVFLFDDQSRSEALRQLGRYASNPELSFTWYDAAVLSQKIRLTAEEEPAEFEHRRFALPQPSDDFKPDELP